MGDALRDAMFRAGLLQMQMAKMKADTLPLVQPSGRLTYSEADRVMLKTFRIRCDD